MKTIQPVPMWQNGVTTNATVLNAYVIQDNLATSATFYYALLSQNTEGYVGGQLAQGNLNMSGADYAAYETNLYAWDWVAAQLNLTITGDYVPPVPVTTTETPVEPTTPVTP